MWRREKVGGNWESLFIPHVDRRRQKLVRNFIVGTSVVVVLAILIAVTALVALYASDDSAATDYRSRLMNNTYTCHDSESCTKKYGLQLETKPSLSDSSKNAFFSSLYSDGYLDGALALGYSLKKYNPSHEIYMMYIPEKVTKETLCILEQAGWNLYPVNGISPPVQGVKESFLDQFTKFQLWNMTEFDGIVYLDADTIVCDKLDGVFSLVAPGTGFEFAAAPDNWYGKFTFNFNAGVLVLRPNNLVYNELLKISKEPGNYDALFAEQSFLNEYYRFRYISLPQTYNMNLAIYSKYPELWKILQPEFKVIHYTLMKPFLTDKPGPYLGPYEFYKNLIKPFEDTVEKIKLSCSSLHGKLTIAPS